MATIFFAWELGENFGHIGSLLPIALEFKTRGHKVFFAVRDTTAAETLLRPHDIPYVQAPIAFNRKNMAEKMPYSYSQILLRCGYDDSLGLAGLIAGWRQLYDLIRPDLTIFDHSPSAWIASNGMASKRALFGTGFYFPPRISPFPNLRDTPIPPDVLQACDDLLLKNINTACARLQIPTIENLFDLFTSDAHFLTTFSEFEHYEKRDGATYLGPSYLDDIGIKATWPNNNRKRIFAYLRPQSSGFERLVSQLRMCDCEVLLFSPGATEEIKKRYASPHIRFSDEPTNLTSLKDNCDLFISYAAYATVSISLLAGIPLLVLPQHLEQSIVAKNAVNLGAAISVDTMKKDFSILPSIKELLTNQTYRDAARAFAKKYDNYHPRIQAIEIVDQLTKLL